MNRHVPSKRTSLAELLKAKEAEYQGRDGIRYRIKRQELEYLATIVDPWDQGKLKLPIIVMTDTAYESGGACQSHRSTPMPDTFAPFRAFPAKLLSYL